MSESVEPLRDAEADERGTETTPDAVAEAEGEPGGFTPAAEADDGGRAVLAGCLAELEAVDPAVKSVEDLERLYPEAMPQLLAAARAGLRPEVLLRGIAFDALAARRVEAARRAATATAAGKGHLLPTGAGGRVAVSVPSEVRALYRGLLPNLSEGEMQAAYEQYARHGKGR